MDKSLIQKVVNSFKIDGKLIEISTLESGNINYTYLSKWALEGKELFFVHQKINKEVFKNPKLINENINLILNSVNQSNLFEKLFLVPTRTNELFIDDIELGFWRTFNYIPNSKTFLSTENNIQAFNSGKAFGQFQKILNTFDVKDFKETILNFSDTKYRFILFQEQLKSSKKLDGVDKEIEFVLNRESDAVFITNLVNDKIIPTRLTHGDLKISNLLFNSENKVLSVIDLDTCMPGNILYDYGDMIRSNACDCSEEVEDFSLIKVNLEYFEQITKGFLSAIGSELTSNELKYLHYAPGLITLNIGIRFLTDFLDGDKYFHTKYEGHNLHRAKVQFELVKNFEDNLGNLKEIVNKLVNTL